MLMPFLVFCAAQVDATALDQLLVIEKARPLALTRTQLQDFTALAKRIAEAHDEARQRLVALGVKEAELNPLLEAFLEGKQLTAEENATLANAKKERSRITDIERAAVDRNIDSAISKLTPEQKMAVIDQRTKKFIDDLASRVFTATDKEWSEVRRYAATLIADAERFSIINDATARWEAETGKRWDKAGSATLEELGIKDDLDQVQKGAEAYVDQARTGRGASKDDLRSRLFSGKRWDFQSTQRLNDAIRFILDSKGSVVALQALQKASER